MTQIQSNFPSSYFSSEKKFLTQYDSSSTDFYSDLEESVLEKSGSLAKKSLEQERSLEILNENEGVGRFSNEEYQRFNELIIRKKNELYNLDNDRESLYNELSDNLGKFLKEFDKLKTANKENKIVLDEMRQAIWVKIITESSLDELKEEIAENLKLLKKQGDKVLARRIYPLIEGFYYYFFPREKFLALDREMNFRRNFIRNIENNLKNYSNNSYRFTQLRVIS